MTLVEQTNIQSRATQALDAAKAIVITDDKSRLAVGEFLKMLKAFQAEVKRDREPERLAAKATVDAIKAARDRHLLPLQEAEKIVKQKQIADEDEQARLRRAEQARLDELARQAQQEAEEQIMAMVAELEDIGDTEQATVLREAPVEAAPAVVIPNIQPKITGQHTNVYWRCRLKDLNEVPRGLLQFDQVAANKWVAGIKAELSSAVFDYNHRQHRDAQGIVQQIAELPNLTVLTKEILGVDTIPGCEIYIEKGRAST